ncbi:protein kinase [Mucilaginibacter sp. CSA2-8R]|uniref:serine/threonine protein kinase n=1 Tax=Mucilaginibacter sp. CSA2-8R TaxID=3141542 RepID=UPI00315D4886
MGKVFTIAQGLENLGALRNGGQGSVYKAKRTGEIVVAVKLLPTPIYSESADDKNFRNFQNEVEKLKKVNERPTPHVVKIYSSGITESGSLPYIEMEYIEGPDLAELLQPPHEPVFTIPEVIKVANQLALALSHCHQVNVNHGDIKSNNIKYNVNTGNYMLLDFGLAIMTDEQRRSSLRNAGAVEFMAPEQNEGELLPQSDIYSYGVILYELLAGVVPFPLTSSAATARNLVMLAHMETPPPDLLELRRQHLPEFWDADKQSREMQVPEWLLSIITRCLQKQPNQRFANGSELHQAIQAQHSALTIKSDTEKSLVLQSQNDSLTNLLLQQREKTMRFERELTEAKQALAQKESELAALQQGRPAAASNATGSAANTTGLPPLIQPKQPGISTTTAIILGFVLIALGVYAGYKWIPGKPADSAQTTATTPKRKLDTTRDGKPIITRAVVQAPNLENPGPDAGKAFTVFADYAYFHNEPNEESKRKANLNKWNKARLVAQDDQNGYIYVEFTNRKGQVSKGWLDKKDLLRLSE